MYAFITTCGSVRSFQFLDGEPIKLPDNLESLPRADHFPTQRHRWNTNEVSLCNINFYHENKKMRPKSSKRKILRGMLTKMIRQQQREQKIESVKNVCEKKCQHNFNNYRLTESKFLRQQLKKLQSALCLR